MADDNDDPQDNDDAFKSQDDVDQDALADEWAAAMEEQTVSDSSSSTASPMALDEFDDPPKKTITQNDDAPDLDVILDIPVEISMQVGSTSISIRNLLQLNQGSVIELDRLAGEPLDVLVNGTLVAHGEVVVVNEKFGIRLTDVVTSSERIRKLT